MSAIRLRLAWHRQNAHRNRFGGRWLSLFLVALAVVRGDFFDGGLYALLVYLVDHKCNGQLAFVSWLLVSENLLEIRVPDKVNFENIPFRVVGHNTPRSTVR